MLRLVASAVLLSSLLHAAPKHTLLAVFAHPDDETVVGPLLAKYAREGHSVYLVTLTAGQLGTTPHAKIAAGEALAGVRKQELACAVKQLGLTSHRLLQFTDQGLNVGWAGVPMNEAADQLRELVNSWKPDVLLTWGPDGGTGHPDHRAASNVTTQVFQMRSRLQHKPKKLYYVVFPEAGAKDEWSPGRRVSDEFITTAVDAGAALSSAQSAVECHKSQWTPEQMRGIAAMASERKGVVYLRLALSDVPAASARETDLFRGLE